MSTSTASGKKVNHEQLANKYLGTGHADFTKYEWVTSQHRDTLASHVGHPDMLEYIAVAQGDSIERVRAELLEKMLCPCGPPPAKTGS